ncbi:MAG TPA: helix-turn-helix transcriptional regulator, partial [Rhizobium sp.]
MSLFLPRPYLCRRIAEETAGVIFLRAPAGAGKTVLLRMVAEELDKHVCTLQQPRLDDVEDGWLFWDVPVSARSARLSAQVLDAARSVVIVCRP